ncbi:MAG: hypothetical protein EA419_11960, partial [Wenzhouxiangella sp.]
MEIRPGTVSSTTLGCLIFAIALALLASCAHTITDPSPQSQPPLTEADIPALVAGMTLAEKAGQMVQVDVSTATPADVGQFGLGSVIMTVPDGKLGTTQAWRELFDGYQREALATR